MSWTSLSLRLGLGVLCGLTLVLLPAVFSTAPPTAGPSFSNTGSLGQARNPSTSLQQGLLGLNSAAGGLSFLTIILFIFLPSIIFSLVIRRWAEKKAQDYL